MNICNVPSPTGYACTRMPGHEGPCALVIKPEYMTRDWEACFGSLGSNWGWASVDYRGVARIHTFAPTFTASGRVALPIGKHNSQPVPAFDVNPVPADWTPITIVRKMTPPYATDRFGALLLDGADLVEAADVVRMPPGPKAMAELLKSGVDNPAYKIARSERCRCTITPEQLAYIVSRELGIDIDGDGPFSVHAHNDGKGYALTVEWERAL